MNRIIVEFFEKLFSKLFWIIDSTDIIATVALGSDGIE